MTQKTVGYVRLEWTCPVCGSRNPGPQKTCSGCGAAQPAQVEFQQAAQEELLQSEEEIRRAKVGPDVHCAYCGARNSADASVCTQCGADLSEAAARTSGRVIGAFRSEAQPDVTCPSCGAANPATALKCVRCGSSLAAPVPSPVTEVSAPGRGAGVLLLVGGIAVVGIIAALIFLVTKTSDVLGTVQNVRWMRSIAVEALLPVTHQAWRDEVPRGAELGRCVERVHHTQDAPASNSKEVCGTPYVRDTGSGYGEVVQDCVYEVYADWCEYTVMEWQPVRTETLQGDDLASRWPETQTASGERLGERTEQYEIVFATDGPTYTYRTRDPNLFSRCAIGSRWVLQVNQLGGVTAIEPAP